MIKEDSRYANAPIYTDADGRAYFGVRTPLEFRQCDDNRTHVLMDGDNLQLLAHRYLGDPVLWWAIADYNNIINPFAPLAPRGTLVIPPLRIVQPLFQQ